MTVTLFSEPLWHWWVSTRTRDFSKDKALLDSLVASWNEKIEEFDSTKSIAPEIRRFDFNPNLVTQQEFIALGFDERLASRIVRYREKGGKFRIKSDLLKIYGVDSAFYYQLHAFITLPDKERRIARNIKKYPVEKAVSAKRVIERFDMNNADTSQLKKIRGIGEKLSMRIIKYRELLGGFVNMDQLREVYGLDSTVINRCMENAVVRDEFRPIKINLNTSSEKQLATHPYLGKAAKAIVSYRFQHGEFEKVEDIRNVGALNEDLIKKVIPYLTVADDR